MTAFLDISNYGQILGTTLEKKQQSQRNTFKPCSAREPNHTHHTVDTFCDAVKNETEQNRKTVKLQNNLSKDEINTLNELQNKDALIITKADKGRAVVIMYVKDYIDEATRQLDNENCYKKLSNDPNKLHAERINISIDQFNNKGIIAEKVAKGLKVDNPKTPKFSTFRSCRGYSRTTSNRFHENANLQIRQLPSTTRGR